MGNVCGISEEISPSNNIRQSNHNSQQPIKSKKQPQGEKEFKDFEEYKSISSSLIPF